MLDDLQRRLAATRWPEPETVDDWSQGVPLERLQALCDYWRDGYDWRRCEALLNGIGQYTTEIDGLSIHFLHRRSPEPNALPLLITHGWPGSVIEFHKVIGPLTDPVAHGGRAEDAFHVIAPSLPGYGFSEKPRDRGWTVQRIAAAWCELMRRLGYDRFVAQGGDWGSAITTVIAGLGRPEVLGVHLNMVIALPSRSEPEPTDPQEIAALETARRYFAGGNAYAQQQTSRPQTLGYGLVDSPVAQAAWIYEKICEWTDCGGDPCTILSQDEILDNVMLYWLPGDRGIVGTALLGELRRFSRRSHRHSGRLQHLPEGHLHHVQALGGAQVSQPDPLEHIGQGRPFRRLRAARAVRGGIAAGLPDIALRDKLSRITLPVQAMRLSIPVMVRADWPRDGF